MKKFFSILAILGLALTFTGQVYAAAPLITAATGGGSISADTCNGTWTPLLGPVLTETAAGDITVGTIIINAPANIEFNTTQNVTAVVSGGGTKLILASNTVTPTASTITFEVTNISVTSPSTITFLNIQVRPKTGSCTTLGTNNMSFGGTSTATGNCGALTTVVGAASKLTFTGQPGTPSVASTAFNPQPIVTIQDKNGNTRTADTNTITLAAYTNNSCTTLATAGTLSGTLTEDAVAGIANFAGNGVKYNKVGTIYLGASTGSLTPACSEAEVITVGLKTKLAFTSAAPGASYTYTNLSVQPVVDIQDADGNKTADTDNVTIKAYTDNACTVAATNDLTGTKTVAAVAGTATFTGIKYNTVYPAGIYIQASSNGVTSACSAIYKVYSNPSSGPVTISSPSSTSTTTTTTSAYVAPTETTTTTTTPATATSMPQPVKPVSQMTQTEKTSYIMELQSYLITLLQQLFNALKARLGM